MLNFKLYISNIKYYELKIQIIKLFYFSDKQEHGTLYTVICIYGCPHR